MNRRRLLAGVAAALWLAAATAARSAETQSVWTEAEANTQAVRMGERFRVVVTAGARNAAVSLPGRDTPWPGCKLLAYSEADVSSRHEGYTARQGRYTLAAFTLREVEPVELEVRFAWPDGTTASARARTPSVQIISAQPKPGFELIEPRPPRLPAPLWPYAAALALPAALTALLWRFPRARRTAGPPPPHLEAFHGLELLNRSRAVAEGRVDHYFTELSRVLRRYLGRRFSLRALELPRREIILALAQAGVPARARHLVNSLLIRADLVKFAKAKVDFPQIAKAQRRAVRFVELTRPVAEVPPAKRRGPRRRGRHV